jgi:hypothetical protein
MPQAAFVPSSSFSASHRRLLKYVIIIHRLVIVISIAQFQIILFGVTATIVAVFATLLGAGLSYFLMQCIG